MKALEIKTSMLFNLDFDNNTILSCFFLFFLIIDLYFLIPAVIAQIFNLIGQLTTPLGTPNKEANTEIEIHPVIVEVKIRECSTKFRVDQNFLSILLINSFRSISSRK